MNNLHICLNNFKYPSRVLRQVTTLARLDYIENIFVASLSEDKIDTYKNKIFFNGFTLKTKKYAKFYLLKFINYIEFTFKVLFFYKKKKIKIVNAHSLIVLPICYLFKLIHGAKIIYDTHELETEKNGLSGSRKKLYKWIEYLLIKKVDHIFVVSENIAGWYEKTYNIARPTVLFNAPNIEYPKKTNYFRDTFHLRDDQIIILYQGLLGTNRGIKILLETFKRRINDKIVIVFMGYGKFDKEIQSTAKSYNNIFFHKAVPPDMLINYTASADIGLATIENNCLSYNFCMPNKLFEYVMAGLPVISSNVKEMADFIKKYQNGVVIENNTVESLNQAIEQLLSMDFEVLKQNAKKVVIDYSWEQQEIKMIPIYKKFSNYLR